MANPFEETDEELDDDVNADADEPSRKQKRLDRYDDLQRRTQAAEERAARVEAEMAALRNQQVQQHQQTQQSSALDEARAEYDVAYKAEEDLADAAYRLDPKDPDYSERVKEYRAKAKDLRLASARATSKLTQLENQPPPVDPQTRANQERFERMAVQNPDVMKGSQQAQNLFASKAMGNAAKDKNWRLTDETAAQIAQEVRQELGIVPRGPGADSTEAQQRTSEGAPAGGAKTSADSFPMSDENLSMAMALYPNLPEKEAFKEWLKGIRAAQKK